ncbi:MAG TPA: CatB-related O-acetyltransferase [Candidatus Megaira endosymbiont of Nemacystus decipiens]|nr:CatB-related O-acetyltransferase [Candidatus Megaera endosymbiont of Nemacystus decipiens]
MSKNNSKNLANKGPNPNTKTPLDGYEDLVFLKNIISSPNIHVGDYTYYDDKRYGAKNFEENNVLYNYQPDRVKLVFGKFCAIAAETKFIMTGDHKLDAISTYPFPIFKNGWESLYDVNQLPIKGDIIVKNDVWFGYNSMVRNGVTIGNGAIIGANSFVIKDVPDYAIVAGNPAKIVKMRFDEKNIARLLEIAWWDWDIEKINAKLPAICSLDIKALGDD